jgi:hypothetical protein
MNFPDLIRGQVWRRYQATVDAYCASLEPLGTGIDIIDLPSEGIVGNSHFLMMDATPMRFSRAWRVGSTP